MQGGAPLPLSAFLDVSDAPAPNNVAATPAATAAYRDDSAPQGTPECLLVPEFLGCHVIASLGEELSLDSGQLRVWCGAALHNDHAAAMLEAQARARQNGANIEDRADRVFIAAGASGSRLIGAPYLRAAVGDEPPLHVWLAPSVTKGGQSQAVSGEAGADAERMIHTVGSYRLRVISAEVIEGGASGDAALQQVETLAVRLAVDRVRGATHSSAACQLPRANGDAAQTSLWLSSQGVYQAAFTSTAASAAYEASAAPPPAAAAPPTSLPPSGGGLLPPIDVSPTGLDSLPPLGPYPAGSTRTGSDEDITIDVGLHVSPQAPLPPPSSPEHDGSTAPPEADHPFGCSPWVWSAELSLMALGGDTEEHVTLPLTLFEQSDAPKDRERQHPEAMATPVPPSRAIRLGPYELRVIRCVGHYVHAADKDAARAVRPRSAAAGGIVASADGLFVSEYPLLLLHVQVSVVRVSEAGGVAAAGAATPQAQVGGAAAIGETSGSMDGGHSLDAVRVPLAPAAEVRRHARQQEAQDLGDAIERMLGL